MTLGEKQRIFTHNVALLICHAYALGYQLSFGNTTAPTSLPTSLHPQRLAIDLNLFKRVGDRWRYQTKASAHNELGEFWENLHPMNVWGGRWKSKDANHYQMGGSR
jgi:hypothetical protein